MAEIIYVMQDFIQTYDNVLDRQTCNTLIKKFDECESNQLSSFASRENRQFTEVQLRDNMDFFKDEYETCLNAFTSIIERYKKDLLIGEIGLVGQKQHMNGLWPKKYGMEGIKKLIVPLVQHYFFPQCGITCIVAINLLRNPNIYCKVIFII
jgi:hypothetical protein